MRKLARCSLVRRTSIVAALLGAMLLSTNLTAAADTPTLGYQGYHCPQLCRTTWSGPGYIGYKLIDDASAFAPSWQYGIEAARQNWTNAPGPQYFMYDGNGLSWDYLQYSHTGDHGNTSASLAVTWNCIRTPSGDICNDNINEIGNYRYSSIWLNHSTIDGKPGEVFNETVTHELGHTMNLAHNIDFSRPSVMAPYFTAPNRRDTPQGDDIGNTNLCGYPPPGGVRCVFQFVGQS